MVESSRISLPLDVDGFTLLGSRRLALSHLVRTRRRVSMGSLYFISAVPSVGSANASKRERYHRVTIGRSEYEVEE